MDTELVTRAQGGDQEAFADLVYAVADRFLAHRILSDIELAGDATRRTGATSPSEPWAMSRSCAVMSPTRRSMRSAP